jgi:2-C-methyl-D-erythritol 4-phosphate cytidylyltransferase/2-C-methyl-D-erythritol 2,4-cyclodiphosphate synthase
MSTALPYRIGYGQDIHRLQAGGKLTLSGIVVSTEISPIAHSDGDVVLHAVVDALLGAIGAGDIGEHFPNFDPQWKNAPSARFVERALELVRQGGYRVGNVDVLIVAERPKLKAFKAQMRQNLAALLSVAPDQVNIKAGTNEECDAIGRGEAIASHCTVLLIGN